MYAIGTTTKKRALELARALCAVVLALACSALLVGCGGGGGTSNTGGGSDVPPPTARDDAEATGLSSEMVDYWKGDWYGYWQWTNTSGEAAQNEGGMWDCMAEFTVKSDGTGHVVIWDNDWGKSDGIAEVDFTITPEGGDFGTLTSTAGWFIYKEVTVGQGQWVLSTGTGGLQNLIKITGHYVDPADSSSYFDYTIYLRPWGTTWDDVSFGQPYYYDWYLGAKDGPMPESIG